MPPFDPMLAKAERDLPEGDYLFDPKWDGFRCIVFRDGDEVELLSRNGKSLVRYFPEILAPLRTSLPERVVLDGELVVAFRPDPDGHTALDFDLLSQRIHPAESRVNKLAAEFPSSFVAFDILALGDESLLDRPLRERRTLLEDTLATAEPPVHLTPATTDRALAADWFVRFEGAGLDGVMAKSLDEVYLPGKRRQIKVKHQRTADCVVAGYRMHKDGNGVGSLLVGLYDDDGTLQNLGVATSFSAARRSELLDELAAYADPETHPWLERWSAAVDEAEKTGQRRPGAQSRWNTGKDLSWTPLELGLVAEVAYEHVQAGRFRHSTRFLRWRPDKTPDECTYEQLEQVPAHELDDIF
jgi:ATP-dependent DNA ligase